MTPVPILPTSAADMSNHAAALTASAPPTPSSTQQQQQSSSSSSQAQSKPKLELEKLTGVEAAKRAAAYAAVDNHVHEGDGVIGIGSGSTVPYVVERIAQQGAEVNEKRWFVPTGFQSRELIIKAGLRLGDVDSFPHIDVTIDGADEVDNFLNCIKGGGACHLREKVLAEAAREFIVVADYRKNSGLLGDKWEQGVPVEVAPFAYAKVLDNLRKLGSTKATLRMAKAKAGPVVTDNGNFCIDAPFPPSQMRDPAELLIRIKLLTGVVEVGLFCGMCKAAYFGNDDAKGTITIKTADGQVREGVEFDVYQQPSTKA
ncbi:hypothetical protein CF319_g6932 [Tilletia indica]|uniref:Ribose-5-phosphate isomerase n=1 Tax=Tilletia indica TaxID=43049 RepID=A0A177TGB7_9BASI|nr:hypothetical protein CF319_g6932 [Tilletia indica]KAE8245210.1 hypothetical protein A4X13_0g6037 [Tilletia indica]